MDTDVSYRLMLPGEETDINRQITPVFNEFIGCN